MRRLVHAVASGYVAIGSTVVFTIASVPLALHYLSQEQFGLWALVSQVAACLALLDLGIGSAAYRFLIDHKDQKEMGEYGAVLSTSALIFSLQGLVIAVAGGLFAGPLANVLNLPSSQVGTFKTLVLWQAVITAIGFSMRCFLLPLQSHQRFDIVNWLQTGQNLLGLGLLWFGFFSGFGVFSLLFAGGVSILVQSFAAALLSQRLGFLPPKGAWSYPRMDTVKELFSFGRDLFLLGIGWQLVYATPAFVITRVLGLEAAAVWSICSKTYSMAQLLVWRLMDFSGPALAEMYVRGEMIRLRNRFKDLLGLTGSFAAGLGLVVALGNTSFVELWTKGRITWSPENDLWLYLWLMISCITRTLNLWVGATKEIRGVKYIYIVQGIAFLLVSLWVAPAYGISGVILSGAIMDAIFAGSYGVFRSRKFFEASSVEILGNWLGSTWRMLGVAILPGVLLWMTMRSGLTRGGVVAALIGTGCLALATLWFVGINAGLRRELYERIRNAMK